MVDNIKIYDDFLTQEELQACADAVKRPAWLFGQLSSRNSLTSTPFWIMMINDDTFFNTHLKSKIESITNRKFTVQRIYANGQTFGQDSTYHQDAASDNSYTFCIYINKQITLETVDNIGGELTFKMPKSTTPENSTDYGDTFSHIAVAPLYNRGILFPSNYFHKSFAFNRYNHGLRISIAWKFQLQPD